MVDVLKRYVKYVVAIIAVGLVALFVDLSAVKSALQSVSLKDLMILLALSFLLVYVSVVKWQAFLERLGITAARPHLFRLYLVGYFVNLLMPSAVGGDVVRSVYVGKNVDKVRAVSATILERYTGLLAMVVMASVSVCFAPTVTRQIQVLTVLVVLGVIAGTVLVASGALEWLLSRLRCPERVVARVARMHEALRWGLSDRSLLVKVGLLSFLFHILTVVNTVAVASAVGWTTAPWADLFVVVPLILLVGAVPISPQGLGLQEGAFVFFLHSVGASTGQALAIALVLRAKSYVLALFGAVAWVSLSKGREVDEAVS